MSMHSNYTSKLFSDSFTGDEPSDSVISGGFIFANANSELQIQDTTFTGGKARMGAALYLISSKILQTLKK
jgi:hypothetical protein